MKIQLLISLLVFGLAGNSARADQLKYLKRPEQGLAAFTTLVAGAKRSIDLTTFIFEPCHASTQVLMELLGKKARDGVRVRLLLDAIMQSAKDKKNLAAFAAQNGIELRWFSHALIPHLGQNQRSHVKLLLVDNYTYLSGGRNVADEYFGLAAGPNFVDRDLLVTGSSARQAAASFEEMWDAWPVSKAITFGKFTTWSKSCGQDQSARIARIKKYLASNSPLKSAPSRSCRRVNFYTDAPDFLSQKYGGSAHTGRYISILNPQRLKRKRATKQVVDFLAGARSRLDIENWLYIPSGPIRAAFDKLRQRRVSVNVITNLDMDGPKVIKNAEEFVNDRSAARDTTGTQTVLQLSRFGSLRQDYALSPKGTSYRLHGKVFVRDDTDSIVSSFNIDPRSSHTNLESVVVVENCPSLAADVKSGIKDLAKTYVKDVKSGRVPPPTKKNWIDMLVGLLGYHFL